MPAPKTIAALREAFLLWDGCALKKTANPVFGHGNPQAEIVFIGEAPGKKEDELGVPFVGAAGKFLDQLLASINLRREDVYITNVVKFRPPENRDPTPEEKRQCRPWLDQELALIQPKAIVTLGRHALTSLFPELIIGETHGRPQALPDGRIVFPIYHPAAALHNGSLRQTLSDDFAALKAYLASTRPIAA